VKKLLFILLLGLVLLVQSHVRVLDVPPHLTLLLVYAVGLRQGPRGGLLTGLLVGAIEDSLSGGVLGPCLLGKATVGYLASFVTRGMFVWTPVLGLVWVAVLTLLDGLIVFGSLSVFAQPPVGFGRALIVVLWQSLMNSPVGLFLRPEGD
jgi:rod shape-determining protein MreD